MRGRFGEGSHGTAWSVPKQIGVSVRTLDRMVAEGRADSRAEVRSKKLFLPESIRAWMQESQENKEGRR